MSCEHKEFIGRPIGFVPTIWECCDCSLKLTPGELLVWRETRALRDKLAALEGRSGSEVAPHACAEHYETVMRQVLAETYDRHGKAYRGFSSPIACEDYMDEVLKRVREKVRRG